MFLVGKGIPDHIKNLPETFLNTPFGQMLKPYLDGMLRGVTQGPGVETVPTTTQTPVQPSPAQRRVQAPGPVKGYVKNVTTLQQLETHLSSARDSCAVIFFTSATCPPCKIVYPAYDELAEEAGDKAVLIKVDISQAYDVSSKYNVRATPTFMTFLKGEKENEWSGANPSQLKGNVQLLMQMAWPAHPHTKLRLPSLESNISTYISYKKAPPLDKLKQKIGPAAEEPGLQILLKFIEEYTASETKPALPNLSEFSNFVQSRFLSLPQDTHFAIIDLARYAFSDSRVSGYFAEEHDHKSLMTLLSRSNDLTNCPYNQQLVMAQLTCNLFTSSLYLDQIIQHDTLRKTCITLATNALQDSRSNLRAAGTSLIYNLAALNHNGRLCEPPETDKLPESDQFELVACLLEAIRSETESLETLHGLLLSLGLLVHRSPIDGEVLELCRTMEAGAVVTEKAGLGLFKQEPLIKEIGRELFGKGL